MADEKKTTTSTAAKKAPAAPQFRGEAPSLTQEELDAKLAEQEGKSSQAQFSTYEEVDPPETNPPAGRLVEQTPGEPTAAEPKRFGE